LEKQSKAISLSTVHSPHPDIRKCVLFEGSTVCPSNKSTVEIENWWNNINMGKSMKTKN